jgi:hypothetical protein
MTVRVLLAAVVALALVGSALPAVEEAQRFRAEQELTDDAERIEAAATAMVRSSDPVPPGVPGARRHLRLDLPESMDASIRLGRPRGGHLGNATTIRTQVAGRQASLHSVDVPIIAAGSQTTSADTDSLVLRTDGVITLTYRVVDGRAVVVASRGFKAGDRTNQTHAGSVPVDG